MTIKELATEMGVTEGDVAGFVPALSVWIAKGYTFEQAIAANMRQMTKLAENAVNLTKSLKLVIANEYWDAVQARG